MNVARNLSFVELLGRRLLLGDGLKLRRAHLL